MHATIGKKKKKQKKTKTKDFFFFPTKHFMTSL
jgi:hypothetical protein